MGSELTFHEGLVNTYFSRDGGHEWFEVAKGSHIYEFGDHGGIIVMANDEAEVTEVQYSWNEGLTWESLHFTSECRPIAEGRLPQSCLRGKHCWLQSFGDDCREALTEELRHG